MVLFNYATRELTAKIVYYGPGLCGKTTNLEYIHKSLPEKARGKMLSLATQTDRTLFFDFLPIDLGSVKGMKTRVQLYTVPGQVFYDATRKLVLKGADGVVFVVDSQKEMMESNLESWLNLKQNLKENNLDIDSMPVVLQFNKRDLPNVLPVKDINKKINDIRAPHFEAVALNGKGVQETLKGVTKLVLSALSSRFEKGEKRKEEAVEKEVVPPEPVEVPASAEVTPPEEDMKELPHIPEAEETAITLEAMPEPVEEAPVVEELEELEELEDAQEIEEVPHVDVLPEEPAVAVAAVEAETPNVESEIPAQERVAPEKVEESMSALTRETEVIPEVSYRTEELAVPVSATPSIRELSIPIQVSVGRGGQEIKLQISIQLKIHVMRD